MLNNRVQPSGFARHIRDALLSKLISGKLRAKNAERFLKEREYEYAR